MSSFIIAFPAWIPAALADVALKGGIITVAAVVAVRLMSGKSAALRHLVWTVTLFALLLLPLSRIVLPQLHVAVPVPDRILDVWNRLSKGRDAESFGYVHESGAISIRTPGGQVTHLLSAEAMPATGPAASPEPVAAFADVPFVAPGFARRAMSLIDFGILVWLLGVGIVLAPLARGLLQLRSYARRATPIDDDRVLDWAHVVQTELGIRRPVRLIAGSSGAMPVTWGITRSVVLLPKGAERWTDARLVATLRHEFAHIARRDSLTQLAGEMATALYWFNPFVWLAARGQRIEREHACDDLVLGCGPRASDYANELVDLARSLRASRTTLLAAMAMARPNGLRDRLVALLDEERCRAGLTRDATVRVALIAAVPFLLLACVAPTRVAPWGYGFATPEAMSVPFEKPSIDAPEIVPIKVSDVAFPAVLRNLPDLVPAVPDRPVLPPPGHAGVAQAQGSTFAARTLRHAARRGMSDNDLSQLLKVAAESGLTTNDERAAYFEAVVSIGSDYSKRMALSALLADPADPLNVTVAVRASQSIDSDSDHATLLMQVLERAPLTDSLRSEVLASLDGIGSKYEHDRVADALLRRR